MAPLVRRTLAPRGQTPILKKKAAHRDRVSLVAALRLSPQRQRIALQFRTYPKKFVNAEQSAAFLKDLVRSTRGPLIVIWDNGSMHRGKPLRELLQRFPRLELHNLPPYAPELNPVEALWNHLKYNRFANIAPLDVPSLDADLRRYLHTLRHKRPRLHSFLKAAGLPFS